MKEIIYNKEMKKPVKSWAGELEEEAREQAVNLANHPVTFKHIALMPDCHTGYGMPIGGVIACENAVIPNAVGVDIGCGMCAVRTDLPVQELTQMPTIRQILTLLKEQVPVGEGHSHKKPVEWTGFQEYLQELLNEPEITDYNNPQLPGWLDKHCWELAALNLGTLGGGNHFIEIQKGDDGYVWLMLHSGSRNLGYKIASYYHKAALALNEKWKSALPSKELAFLPADEDLGKAYIRDMNLALNYAMENRQRMLEHFRKAFLAVIPGTQFMEEINIHHNYAALEHHFERNLWVHRKGATSAKAGETGIIPGSMGTSSYIVKGLGNPESFQSCSHGAGRKMSRSKACEVLTVDECNKAMDGIVFDRWKMKTDRKKEKKQWDLEEAPQAYKDIDEVIEAELDLIQPLVKLQPLGVVKG